MKTHQRLLVYFALLGLVCFSNLPLVYGQFFGEDEASQFWVSMRVLDALSNWQGCTSVNAIGVALSSTDHPPLRYILSVPGIVLFPYSEFGLRFSSILFSLLMTYQLVKLGTALGGDRVGLASGFCVACSGVYNWTSMAFGWSVTVTVLVIAIQHLRTATLDLSQKQERRMFCEIAGLLFIAFLINTGNILFFVSFCLIYLCANYRRMWLLMSCILAPTLLYVAYYAYYFVLFPWLLAQRQGTAVAPVGQLAHMISRSERSHLNITSFIENVQGINAYLLPGLGWILVGAAWYALLRREWRVLLFVAPFAVAWSFYFIRSTQQYFLLVCIAILPFGIAWFAQRVTSRQFAAGVAVLCVGLLVWNMILFIRPYAENEYPHWLLDQTFSLADRYHNIGVPYTAIGQDIDALLSPTGMFIHRLGGSFTDFYYRDDPSSITHTRYAGALDSAAFPIVANPAEPCVRLDNVHRDASNVEIVVGRFVLCPDTVRETRTYAGSPIKLYVLASSP